MERSHEYTSSTSDNATQQQHLAFLQTVIANAPDYILKLDLQGNILFINRGTPNQRAEELIGLPWTSWLQAEAHGPVRDAFETVRATNQETQFETQIARPGGITSWYECRLGPIAENGKISSFILVARDITDKKHAEAQLIVADRMASIGTLVAGIGHEINNPLSSIISNLDMALQDITVLSHSLPRELRDEVLDARNAAERVRSIVRDLKTFSRSDEDRREPVSVELVLESTLRMLSNEIRHRAQLIKHFSQTPPVVANESRLGQVFLNLIMNALQAIPEGDSENNSITITTSIDASLHVVVTIKDTGSGIPANVRDRLFTPFFSTKPAGFGAGLGLAISHRIITSLDGEISFSSEPKKGTEFRITLPSVRTDLISDSERKPPTATATRRGKVLVVDDEEMIVRSITRILSADHDVTGITSAQKALDLFKEGMRFDVILCDVQMPSVTGMDLFKHLQELDPGQATRMVFLTGGAFTSTAREFLQAMSNQHIEKPLNFRTLKSMVNKLVG